jgi:hypothetical protein
MKTLRSTRWTLLGTIALGVILLAADAPPQTIDAGGLTFKAPAAWKSTPPKSSMRRAQLSVPAVEGDEEPAELVVFAFPGGGGTAEANIQRWRSQFKDENGNPPKVESKEVKGKNVDVTRVETSGRYVAPVFPGSSETFNKPNFRLLAAIVQAGDTGYYLKMVGPAKTMKAAQAGFDDLIASIRVENRN